MVSVILSLLEEGLTFKEIAEEYPELQEEDIKAAVEYARLVVENEDIRTLDQVA